jgi:hypothetical protein
MLPCLSFFPLSPHCPSPALDPWNLFDWPGSQTLAHWMSAVMASPLAH